MCIRLERGTGTSYQPKDKLLISGASGFVGRFLLDRLLESGASSIVCLHRSPLSDREHRPVENNLRWIQADIAADDLSPVLQGVDTVFHLAAYSTIGEAEDDRHLLTQVNVEGTRRLAEFCKRAGVRHFIMVSSIAAGETAAGPVVDEINGRPISSYGQSKKSAEDTALALAGDGFEVTALRPTALFGEFHQGSVYELVRMIQRNHFVIFGGGKNRTNFYYVRDFVEVLIAVRNNPAAFGRVFIAADKPCSLEELAEGIATLLHSRRRIPRIPAWVGLAVASCCDLISRATGKSLPLSQRRFHAMVRDVAYSNHRLTDSLDIHPTYGLMEGLHRTIQWYRQAGLL